MDVISLENKLEKRINNPEICKMACLYLELSTPNVNIENTNTRRMIRIIATCFGDICLDDISVKFAEDFLLNPKLKKEDHITAVKFLIYIIKKNFMDNEILSRLVLFERYLKGRDLPRFIRYIFRSDRFSDFLEKGFFKSSSGVNVFAKRFNEEDFLDNRIYNMLSSFLEEEKLKNDNISMNYINSRCNQIIKVSKDFFSEIKYEDITVSYINNTIKSDRFSENYVPIKRLCEVLIFFNYHIEIKDDSLKYILLFQDFLLSNKCTINCLRYILNSRDIENAILNMKIHGIRKLIPFINIKCEELLNQWLEFYKQKNGNYVFFQIVSENFDNSLDGFNINSLDDINFETFESQLFYFYNNFGIKHAKLITSFYLFLSQNYNPNIFDSSGVNSEILQRCGLVEELTSGFKIISYNPMEDIPKEDKWLLCYRHIDNNNSSISTTGSKLIDLTRIKSEQYRFWVKHYLWKNTSSIKVRLNSVYNLIEFFNYIHDLKSGEQLSIYCKSNTNLSISPNEVLAYKMYILNKLTNEKTKRSYLNNIKMCLKNISYNNIASFEPGVFYILKYKVDNTTNPKALSNEEISKLVTHTKELSLDSVINEIYHAIICLLIETEFRISQILSLTTDCIQEANKKNQYVIISNTKVSDEQQEQPISIQTKRTLENIIKITSKYRKNCTVEHLKNYIFLIPGQKIRTYKIITPENVRRYIQECCESIGIDRYNTSNLRDTHITKVKEFIEKNKMSDLNEKVLTGHFDINSNKSYEDIDIRTLLEATYGMIIGDVDIKGRIVDKVSEDVATDENTVYNGCGYCDAETCHDTSYLECLMCKDFIATISRIPFFKKQIELIDEQILIKTIRHDKEDLMNIKKLLLGYLNRLLELAKGLEGNE